MSNGKIYVNQSSLKLTLDTGVILTGAIAVMIGFIKPDGTQSSWLGAIVDQTKVKYDFSEPSELDISGNWDFWAYVVFADGRNAPGEPIKVKVYEQGT